MSQWSTLPPSGPESAPSREFLSPESPNRTSVWWWRWGTVGLVLAVVLLPLLAKQLPREVSRWYAAIALEHHLEGQREQALASLAKALEWDPSNATVYMQRAIWRGEVEQYEEALSDCDQAVHLAPWNVLALVERSQVYQYLGRSQEAVEDWKMIAELNETRKIVPDVQLWNGLAYARAVAGVELQAGLEDIERALKREPDEHELIDTRGFLLHKLDRNMDALKDIDQAVAYSQARRKKFRQQAPTVKNQAAVQRARKQRDKELAVILYHRSLVFDKLGSVAAAAADRDLVRQLGYKPGPRLF